MMAHPEQRPGEVLLTNVYGMDWLRLDRWKSRRLGEVAYDQSGGVAKGYRPMFVNRAEVVVALGEAAVIEADEKMQACHGAAPEPHQ
jgi:hypothetical protein